MGRLVLQPSQASAPPSAAVPGQLPCLGLPQGDPFMWGEAPEGEDGEGSLGSSSVFTMVARN